MFSYNGLGVRDSLVAMAKDFNGLIIAVVAGLLLFMTFMVMGQQYSDIKTLKTELGVLRQEAIDLEYARYNERTGVWSGGPQLANYCRYVR